MRWLLLLILIPTGCIEFSISDEKAISQFENEKVPLQIGDLQAYERNIHYVYTNQLRDNLAIFVHGSPGSWSAFLDFFKADTLLQDFDLLAIDRPGFGKSGYGIAEPSIEKQADLLDQVVQQFPHLNKILIGHSLGGPVIARMAMDYSDRYSGLVFIAPSIDPEMEKEEWYRDVIATRVGGFFTPKDFEVSNDEIRPLKQELEDMLPLWSRIRIPSIVIQGTEDSLVPKENADFAMKMLPDSLLEVRLLKDVDHFIPWSHPGEVIEAIRRLADAQ